MRDNPSAKELMTYRDKAVQGSEGKQEWSDLTKVKAKVRGRTRNRISAPEPQSSILYAGPHCHSTAPESLGFQLATFIWKAPCPVKDPLCWPALPLFSVQNAKSPGILTAPNFPSHSPGPHSCAHVSSLKGKGVKSCWISTDCQKCDQIGRLLMIQ